MRQLRLLIIAMLLSTAAFAQTRQITGSVKDSKSGAGLPTVTVLVKGKSVATVSGADGSFTLKGAPESAFQLQFSLVGYTTKTIEVAAGQNSVSTTLEESATQLGELVVTALGIAKDNSKLGYSVAKVGGELMTKARETNVALSLGGRVSGVNVHGSGGGPGSSARILLRGMPSMNSGGSPLFVINGVPMDNTQRGSAGEWGGADAGDGIGNLNPDDIEDMTVLKGQAASALYGARAANGVILITTKSGKKGAFSVDYNMNYAVDKAIDFTDWQYTYGQGTGGVKPANASGAQGTTRLSWGGKLDGSSFTQFDGKSYAYSAYKDNIKNFYRPGPTFTNTVSMSSGGDKGTFRLSLSNLDNQSIVRNSGLNRKSINLNVDQNITPKLNVKVMANYIDELQKNKPQLSDGPLNVNNGLFIANNINEKILDPGYDANGAEILWTDDNYVTNPWFVINRYINNIGRKRLISAVTVKYNLTDWLYASGRVGYDYENDRILKIEPTGTDYTKNQNYSNQTGSYNLQTPFSGQLNGDVFVGVSNKNITKDLVLSAVVGANMLKNNTENITISGGPFIVNYLYTPTNVYTFNRSYAYTKKESHSGYYSVDLNWKSYLNLSTTGRYDAFSTLAGTGIPNSQVGIFTPSVSGSFVFSELTKMPKMSYGKIRASYAQTSGEPVKPYQTMVYYGLESTINGTPTGRFSNTLPSGLLKPFTVTEVEVGAELKWFDNRLGLDVAYFHRKTKNEIMSANFSLSTGYNAGYVPTGSTMNKGLEVLINGTPITNKDFNWNVSFNLTSVKNEILHTDNNNNTITLGTDRPNHGSIYTAYQVGKAGPQILGYDYKMDGKGNIVVDDAGLPLQGDLKSWGTVLPTLYGGLNNDFSYKNITFSFLIDYNYGNKVLSATKAYSIYRGLNKETLNGRETGITTGVYESGATNTKSVTSQAYYQAIFNRNITGPLSVLNGDYIKLRQLTLGYTLSEKLFGSVPLIRSINVSLVGRNLWTIMRKSGIIDPESGFSTLVSYAGIEGTSVPSARTYGVNVNVKFK